MICCLRAGIALQILLLAWIVGAPIPACLTAALESITGREAHRNVELDTCLCQTLWASAEWVLRRAKMVWRKSRANNAIQNTTKWTFEQNYTNITCLQDLHRFAHNKSLLWQVQFLCSPMARLWFCKLQYKQSKNALQTASISHNLFDCARRTKTFFHAQLKDGEYVIVHSLRNEMKLSESSTRTI